MTGGAEMANNQEFVHLPLPFKYAGKPKLRGGGGKDTRTTTNCNNRRSHGNYLKRKSGELSRFWHERRDELSKSGFLPIDIGVPFLLEIDPTSDVDFLYGLGFEIVCSLEDGFILVASVDADLSVLNERADIFIEGIQNRCNTPARIYALKEDNERLKMVLSEKLYSDWGNINDSDFYIVDIGISCGGTIIMPKQPPRKSNETDEHYNVRYEKWQKKCTDAYLEWDEIASERQDEVHRILSMYDEHEIPDGFVDETDSFSFRLKISGKGLRDFVLNYPYIFEVTYAPEISMETSAQGEFEDRVHATILAPKEDDPIVCVIDSGIQEGHRYISSAIIAEDSLCLIPDNTEVSDEVSGGGHGTRVAGAILFPKTIPSDGTYQLPCRIRNIRVLDNHNTMPLELSPTNVVPTVIKHFFIDNPNPSRTFNHSIGERFSFTSLKHMSAWAAQIDLYSYEQDVLFVQAAGNIPTEIISSLLKSGHSYPSYFNSDLARLANPAQSLQALTVGSVSLSNYETEDIYSMGGKGEISSFSRVGPGIWDTIKPDVVEYGGTHAANRDGNDIILTTPKEVCPELIRTSPPGPAFDSDAIGTSFSAPKVTHIISEIEKIMPNSSTLLYRALVAQSARWINFGQDLDSDDCQNKLRHLGYGFPSVERATHNSDYRVTLVTSDEMYLGEGEAHIYSIKIPDSLNRPGEDFDILIEVTLSYSAKPRRTRRYLKGYLSTWLDWVCSKNGEHADTFARRIFVEGKAVEDEGNFKWMIGESRSPGQGIINNFSRSKGTLQKDWCVIKSNQFSDAFCIAVRGHKGWSSVFKAKYSLAVSFEAISKDIEIYEPIRVANEVEVETPEISLELNDVRL